MVKILTGDLRIGLREGLVEEAIARAFDVSLEEVKQANMLLGDIGRTALLASRKELHSAELSMFRPIKCMLATPEPTADAVWNRFIEVRRPRPVRLVDRRRRCTLKTNSTGFVHSFIAAETESRFSRAICDELPGNFQSWPTKPRKFDQELIADGEIIAFDEGRRLTFFDLQKRLGRKERHR